MILLVVASCLIATGCCNTYYVVAPDGAPCPSSSSSSSSSSSCQELSSYISQPSVFFTDNTVIYFLEGHHMLHQQDLVMISGVTNLTLQGLGTMETGPHETVIQSTVVIRCSRSTGGFIITDSQSVTISTITVSGCASRSVNTGSSTTSYGPAAMGVVNSYNTRLEHVSLQNASGYGLLSVNSFNLSIENSSFYHNQYSIDDECGLRCPGGNARVVFEEFASPLTFNNTLDIIKSNFSFSFGMHFMQGSGLSIELNNFNHYKLVVCIDEVVAYGNTGVTGANIYISISSSFAQYKIFVKNTLSLHGNIVPLKFLETSTSGAGLYFVHNSRSATQAYLSVSNSTFSHNQADTGGGMYVAWTAQTTGLVQLDSCNFQNNTGNVGSALYILGSSGFSVTSCSVSNILVLLFNNVIMDINQPSNQKDTSSLQSTMTLQNVASITFDGVSILNSLTTGLIIFGSNVFFKGKCIISNNSGIDGGGMALYGCSYIVLYPLVVVSLTANHASRYGGGMYVNQPIAPSQNAQCFFESTMQLSIPGFATIAFSKNTADIAGSALYGGNQLEKCTSLTNFQSVFQLSDQPGPSNISSDPIDICLCSDNDEVICSTSFNFTSAVPGGEFAISVGAVGNLNGLTPATLVVHFSNKSVIVNTSAHCKRLAYTLTVTDGDQTEVQAIISLESFLISPLSRPRSITATIHVEPCPTGFELGLTSGICECSNQVSSVLSSVSCNVQTETITRTGDVWVGYSNESDCTLVSTNCPLDYCNQESVSFLITDPNPQCALNRSGVLCGGCDNGLSLVLGTNRCAECSNVWLTLLLLFAVAGIALVAFLIALNLTVSVGTINGLIFFANIVKIEESIFFPNGPIPLLSQFISWINLDLGIELCFFDGMSSCSKMWLQYLFPIYIWLILAAIVVFARFSQRLLRLVGSHIVPVLSTLLLLSYTKLIRNVILAMYVSHVSCDTASHELAVWSLNGNIKYFSGCHLPLFIVALLALIFLIIPYTLFLAVSPFIEAYLTGYKCFRWVIRLKPVLDAYGGPYCDKFRVWTGFLLLVRVLLALITSLSDNRHVSIGALMCTMVILLIIHYIAGKVYNKWYLNALEITFLLNLILLGYFEMVGKEITKEIALIVLLSISLVVFLGIVLYHIALRVKPDLSTEWIYEKMRKAFVYKKRSKTITNGRGPDVVAVQACNMQLHDDGGHREPLLDSEFHEFIDDK